ncbi:MAG: hypothetical protein ABW275_00585 [Hansschlegelia sp.]
MSDLICSKLRRFDPALLQHWLQLPPEHAGLVVEFEDPSPLLARLRELGLWPEAMRLLAYALPEREAVWWSCMCVRHTATTLAEPENAAVEAAEDWVRGPGPRTRQEAAMAASAAGYAAPGSWSALGATWSHREQFMADLCGGRGAAMAVTRAAGRHRPDPEALAERFSRFFDSGVEIGNGGAGRLPAADAVSEVVAAEIVA